MKLETLSIRVGREIEPGGDVAPAIHLSTTFERAADGEFVHGYSYARAGNPSRKALEQCISALEGGQGAVTFASGSAASLAVFNLLRPGDHVIAPIESYHGTAKQLRDLLAPLGIEHSFVNMSDESAIRSALRPSTRLIWIETPSNPMLNITDIEAVTQLAHEHGALVCSDNTFATPVCQRPFDFGVDLVMHSSTKYFGGHSDVMGGAIIVREAKNMLERLREYQETAGSVPSPFDCWLIRRSLTTLSCRVRAQTETAAQLAEFLSKQTNIERVFYPGLAAHPRHALARKQMKGGFGAMLSFCVKGGRAEAFAFANKLQYFTRATSLGGVESLIEHRASIEGPHSVTPENLLRISVGLEHIDDLIADFEQALKT
ncbi:MAG: trans-sulfuration enzyme family protein [Povalibacter sp.]